MKVKLHGSSLVAVAAASRSEDWLVAGARPGLCARLLCLGTNIWGDFGLKKWFPFLLLAFMIMAGVPWVFAFLFRDGCCVLLSLTEVRRSAGWKTPPLYLVFSICGAISIIKKAYFYQCLMLECDCYKRLRGCDQALWSFPLRNLLDTGQGHFAVPRPLHTVYKSKEVASIKA
ncbi:uncharacterized protein K444DRAFT_58441 [Hyaloscypha bicolor E]|uniref:Uncharacterized protein n=1 Tax=Hyaloscypha bicolor E TaxID=1095630 RepID=A0A2J6SZU0_9HELO|nr:uncharacterized protein K444DRAFT_58441 [Hyaloscypha bicolor E]PMD56277.1 hypothetical protein K444DRAFT_58441 [Hyaloscypha bicolor E]